MRCKVLVLAVFALEVTGAARSGESPPWEVWTDLRLLAVVPQGDQVATRTSHCLDGCGTDRHSKGDERFVRVDGDEGVIFEERGPGAIVRIWMTTGESGASTPIDPATSIRFYFDGEPTPRIDLPLSALFDGANPPFEPPLVGDRLASSGGNFSYLPIPYQQSCRVVLAGDLTQRLWYQFTFHRLAPDAEVPTYTGAEDLSRLRNLLEAAGDPWPVDSGRVTAGTVVLEPGVPQLAWTDSEAGTITELALDLAAEDRARTRLTASFDGLTTIDLPVADLFAAGSTTAVQSLLAREELDGELRLFWPMPYGSAATLALTVDGGSTNVALDYRVRVLAGPPLAGSGLFAAALSVSDPSEVGMDHPLLALTRPGKWVGLYAELGSVETMMRQYLEGDERVYLDGLRHPTLYGTGTEDFFNGGFYFDQGLFAQPLHGLLEQGVTADDEHRSVAYRWLLTDAVPFGASIRAGLEGGNTADLSIRARTVAYHYVDPGPALVSVDELDLGDPASRLEHDYQVTGVEEIRTLDALFEGEPATALVADGGYRERGGAQFALTSSRCVDGLRVRRLWDAGLEGQAFDLRVAGVAAGGSEFSLGNPDRRWAENDFELPVLSAYGDRELLVEVDAAPANGRGEFTAFRYELFCRRAAGALFSDGFESGHFSRWSQVVP